MEPREKDIQELCRQVLDVICHYSPSSSMNAKENTCPFCGADGYWNQDINEIEHDMNCAYLIAKDLSTNF